MTNYLTNVIVFHDWNEVGFLVEFFRQNAQYLKQPFWHEQYPEPEDAAKGVIIDAIALEKHLEQLTDNVKAGDVPDFETYFKPLGGKYLYEWNIIPMKGYGMGKPTFIRLYAIRIQENCFLIAYGGLKLADTIQNSPGLDTEVFRRIDYTLAYMKREGITDSDDLKE